MQIFTGSKAGDVVVQTSEKSIIQNLLDSNAIDEIKVESSCCDGGRCGSSEDHAVSETVVDSCSSEDENCCSDEETCCGSSDYAPNPETPVASVVDTFSKWVNAVAEQLEERAKAFEEEVSEKTVAVEEVVSKNANEAIDRLQRAANAALTEFKKPTTVLKSSDESGDGDIQEV